MQNKNMLFELSNDIAIFRNTRESTQVRFPEPLIHRVLDAAQTFSVKDIVKICKIEKKVLLKWQKRFPNYDSNRVTQPGIEVTKVNFVAKSETCQKNNFKQSLPLTPKSKADGIHIRFQNLAEITISQEVIALFFGGRRL